MDLTRGKGLTPMRAIRAKCLDCSCGNTNEVKLCPVEKCSLYPYRMGHNPKLAGKGSGARNMDGLIRHRELRAAMATVRQIEPYGNATG